MPIRLGEMLIDKKLITREQLDIALKEGQKTDELIGRILIKNGFIKEEEFFRALSDQLHIPYLNLKDVTINPEAVKKVSAKFARHYKVLPIEFKDNVLTLATCDPLHSINEIKLFLGYEIEPVLVLESEIVKALEKYYGVGAETVEGIIAKDAKSPKNTDKEQEEKVEDIEKIAGEASIVKLVNQIILEANKRRATDIHIEPFRGKLNLRYRIDGVLYNAKVPQEVGRLFPAIISRIKIMSNLNIVERRLPQDGRAMVKIGKNEFDLRMSIIPTRQGEGVVIRILPTKMIFSLEKLGLEKEDLNTIEALIKKTHGIIFLTGPTGSGKTTTLYTCLNHIKSSKNKIITIEDPVEYEIEGLSQIQVIPSIGFTFAQGLRSVLRHDPDIMMVGEVRDFETAELAIRIALTGHLIFSTLHTNDAAGGVTRLLDMGIEPFLVSSSLEAFIAQRLVRIICPKCKESDDSVNEEVRKQIEKDISDFMQKQKTNSERLNFEGVRFYKGKGCENCNGTGFASRSAIYEILVVSKAIKDLIMEKASRDKIRDKGIEQGMRTLRIAGWKKVVDGVTTPQEVMRVTQAED